MITAGVDVGGLNKGYHAVAMHAREVVAKTSSCDPTEIATWCKKIGAQVVAVDAPVKWSSTGGARSAERALMQQGIWCFSTPTEKAAKSHPRNYFGWMLQGAKLYRALDKSFARFDGTNERARPICFETFPHAIACALNGAPVSARKKREVRRAFLEQMGICCDSLTNIDFVDAALCAVTAECFANRRYIHYGDAGEGYIVVPRLGQCASEPLMRPDACLGRPLPSISILI
jgi:predicted nuclease with RNAse H fold